MILSNDIKDMVGNLISNPTTIKKVSAKPIVGPSLLEIPSYSIKFVLGDKDKSYRNLNMMEIRPIELDASILFYNKKNKQGPLLPISLISDIKKISHYKGVFNKKEKPLVEITFSNQENKKIKIRINIEESKIDKFLQQIIEIQNILQKDNKTFPTSYLLNFSTNNDTSLSTIEIFPEIPFLSQGEEIIWKNIITKKGLEDKKKVDYMDLVTNYRIFHYSYIDHKGSFILIRQIKDIVVDSLHHTHNSNIKVTENKSDHYEKENIKQINNDNTDRKIIGNVTVTCDEKKSSIVFKEILDPNGVANTIKSLKKQCNFIIDEIILPIQTNGSISEIKKEIKDDNSNIVFNENMKFRQSLSIQNSIVCNNCKKINTANSNFCNRCGFKLNILKKCIKCNYSNAHDALFCNICGSRI